MYIHVHLVITAFVTEIRPKHAPSSQLLESDCVPVDHFSLFGFFSGFATCVCFKAAARFSFPGTPKVKISSITSILEFGADPGLSLVVYAITKTMGKAPRSGKHASSSSVASTAVAASVSSHHQRPSSQQQKVSSTITSMLQELATLVGQTQVSVH